MIRLTREQTQAAEQHPDGVRCEGDGSPKTFILVEEDVMERMKRALYRQDVDDSLTRSIAQMEAGETMSLEESAAWTRDRIARSPAKPG